MYCSNNYFPDIGIPLESVKFLFLLSLTKHLKELYQLYNIKIEYFDLMVLDLKCKLMECKKIKNIWGTFVVTWYPGFYRVERLAIGRLQFEMKISNEILDENNNVIYAPRPFINVHIPSSGPLNMDDVHASFDQAAKVYGKFFKDNKILFGCNSWLLAPYHDEILPESSNIRKFKNLFEIISCKTDIYNLWRIFGTENCDDLDALESKTTLQKAYIKFLKSGGQPQSAFGVRYY